MIINLVEYGEECISSSESSFVSVATGVALNSELSLFACDSSYPLLSSFDRIRRFCEENGRKEANISFVNPDQFGFIDNVNKNELSDDVVKRAYSIFDSAIEQGTSDIHIIRQDDSAEVCFRISGSRVFQYELDADECDEIIFVMYNILASTKETTWNRQVAQNANIIYKYNNRPYRMRYAHNPVFSRSGMAYHVVLRVIVPSVINADPTLDFLRLSKVELDDVVRIVSQPFGIYVIAGTTGSGKSLTLKTIMEWMAVHRYERKGVFLSVEDPVEYEISGCFQSSVTAADTKGMANAIKSALRRDPDVLMIGEVRDEGSATALATAVESGHYCFTTLHAGNIPSLLSRLASLGIGTEKMSTPGFVAGLQCQKLVPLICQDCKIELEDGTYRRNDDGCKSCNYTGGAGRQLVCEYLIGHPDYLPEISQGRFDLVLNKWKTRQKLSFDGLGEGFSIKEKVYFYMRTGKVCRFYFEREFGGTHDIEQGLKVFLDGWKKV